MSRKWALLLVLMLISATFTILITTHSLATEPTRVYVDPPSIIDPPEFFNVSVKVENVQDLMGVQMSLSWDPSFLWAVNVTDVIYHETVPQSEWDNIWPIRNLVDNTLGTAKYAYTYHNGWGASQAGYAPISGNFTIFVILFQVRGVGNCTLHLGDSKLGDSWSNPIAHDTIDGFVSNTITPLSIPPSPPSDAQITCYLEPCRIKNESLAINSTFSVSVKLDDVASKNGVRDILFQFEWNSTVLECVNTSEVMFHEATPVSEWFNIGFYFEVDNTLGHLRFASWYVDDARALSMGYEPVFGNHTVVILTFRVKSIGKSPLALHDIVAYDELNDFVRYAVTGGFFANAITVDLNGDGTVDLFDALLLAKSYGSRPDLQSWNEDTDINGDGVVDIYDAITLCNCFGHTR
jgi:hypothetical protein